MRWPVVLFGEPDECLNVNVSISTRQAGDDAKIRVWRVPEGGLQEMMTEPEMILQGRCEPPASVSLLFSHNAQQQQSQVS